MFGKRNSRTEKVALGARLLLPLIRSKCLALTAIFAILFCSSPAQSAPKNDVEWYKSAGNRSERWDSLVQSGFEALDSGNFNTALTFLMRAHGKGCRDGLLLYKIGIYHEVEGNTRKALQWFQKAEGPLNADYPTHPATLGLPERFGTIYFVQDDYDKALGFLEQAVQKQGGNFMRHFLIGQIYGMKKDWSKAAISLESALQYDPPGATHIQPRKQVWIELMRASFELEQWKRVLEISDKILEFEPGNPAAHAYRQKVQEMENQKRERELMERIVQ